MNILVFTSLFPNNENINRGVFIKERVRNYTLAGGAKVIVVAPVPYFPAIPFFPRWSQHRKIKKEEYLDGIQVLHPRYITIPKIGMTLYGLLMFLSLFLFLKRLNNIFPIDIIDAHWVYPDSFAAVLFGKCIRRPVFVSARGSDINNYARQRIIKHLIYYTLRNATHIITVSAALRNIIVKELGIETTKISVIPNGVDRGKFYLLEKKHTRDLLRIPKNKKIILTVGTLRQLKGQSILIEAVRQIPRNDVLLLIIGEGKDRTSLEDKIRQWDLADKVQLLGAKPHYELRFWYAVADLFALASEKEGCPNVVLEAMACGKPVITTDVGDICEIISSRKHGIIVESRTPQAFASAIEEALYINWEEDAIQEYAAGFTWEVVALQLCSLFSKYQPQKDFQ